MQVHYPQLEKTGLGIYIIKDTEFLELNVSYSYKCGEFCEQNQHSHWFLTEENSIFSLRIILRLILHVLDGRLLELFVGGVFVQRQQERGKDENIREHGGQQCDGHQHS